MRRRQALEPGFVHVAVAGGAGAAPAALGEDAGNAVIEGGVHGRIAGAAHGDRLLGTVRVHEDDDRLGHRD